MCGDTLKAALRVNREIADKKNELIFAAKRAKMGDTENPASSSATATTTATATSTASGILNLLYSRTHYRFCLTSCFHFALSENFNYISVVVINDNLSSKLHLAATLFSGPKHTFILLDEDIIDSSIITHLRLRIKCKTYHNVN